MVTEMVDVAESLLLLNKAAETASFVLAYSRNLQLMRKALRKLELASDGWDSANAAMMTTVPERERGAADYLQFIAEGDQLQACAKEAIEMLRELVQKREREGANRNG